MLRQGTTRLLAASSRSRGTTLLSRNLHASATHFNKSEGDPEKSPFKVFTDTFRQEWQKSKELQDDLKALQDETGRMSESAAFQRAKEAMDKAKKGGSSASSAVGKGFSTAGKAVGSAASKTWDSKGMKYTRDFTAKTIDGIDKTTEPIRQTEFYKDIKEVIDDGSSNRYGGYEDKEARRKRRDLELKKRLEHGASRPVKEDITAGTALEAHATAEPDKPKWSENFQKSRWGKRWADTKLAYEESENGLVSTVRSITDKIGWFFEETEAARVVRYFRQMDPNFRQDDFLSDIRSYILPEVLDAYVKGDEEVLKNWLSEAPFNIWKTSTKQYKDKGLYSAGRVLDIRGIDILNAKILQPSEIPVYVIGCRAQEVHVYKNLKTDVVEAGMEDHIQMSTYALVITRVPEEMDNAETNGWKILELVRGQSREWT